ncbi:MAG: hypothetical protein ACKOPN_02215 [Prochlorococcaceae cyanobacterium]
MPEPFPREGLPLAEARRRVLAALTPLSGRHWLPLAACLGRVSAEACTATEAVPGFRASIMDGYAIADATPPAAGATWRLVGRSAPGAPFAGVLAGGEAIRILTGAPLPEGAERVLPQELERAEAQQLRLEGEAGTNPWPGAASSSAGRARSCWRRGCGWARPTWAGWRVVAWRRWRCGRGRGSAF